MEKEYINIHNFKCFVDQNIELNNLTVFVGVNGAGKSTVIQALLLLRSSLLAAGDKEIALDGIFGLDLGTSSSIVNQNSEDNYIALSAKSESGGSIFFNYMADIKEDRLSLSVADMEDTALECLSVGLNEFHYINAERIGPRISSPLTCMKYQDVGTFGQNVAQVIAYDGGRTKVDVSRMFENTENPNIEFQVNAWLSYIMPGVRVSANMDLSTLSAQIRVSNDFTMINPALATNFGFGVSYSLPIVVQALIAQKGSLMIVENPEAHLHPAAQSAMGIFLAKMAYAGVRILIETHSDHVINGIQNFVAQNKMWHTEVTINHFSVNHDNNRPKVMSISFDDKANYTNWPDGFMDQNQKDFLALCKVRSL